LARNAGSQHCWKSELAHRESYRTHCIGRRGNYYQLLTVPTTCKPPAIPLARACATFKPDRHALVDWLLPCGLASVAMASAGVYGGPIFECLEPRGIKLSLVNAREVKTVPGRKRDWHGTQWWQPWHALGWWQGALRPGPLLSSICCQRSR
jgi:hypothetical protein